MRRTWPWLLLVAVAAVLPAAEKAADDLPAHIDITLRDVRFQPLPDGVNRVYVGPDDRTWSVMRGPQGKADIPRVQRLIEREFAQKNPQIMQAEPVLFEPGGRVWFVVDLGTLIAYDGRTWIGPDKGPHPRIIRSACPNNGPLNQCVWADGTAFFADDHGVQTFTGAKSDYKVLFERMQGDIRLVPMPDGKTVLAHQGSRALWRWRAGEWSEVKLPAGSSGIFTVIPRADGAAIIVQSGGDPPYVWREGTDAAADFAALVARLGNADFKVRDAATQDILAQERVALDPAKKALAAATDPEIKARLAKIVEALTPAVNDRTLYFRLGRYRIHEPVFAYLPQTKLVLVSGRNVIEGAKSLGPGLVVAPPGGEPALVSGGAIAQIERFVAIGKQVWCCPYEGQARLLDVEKMKYVDDGPGVHFPWLQAARADGTMFIGSDTGGIIAYRPGSPDDRRFIDVKGEQLVDRGAAALADDGILWAVRHDSMEMLSRYDGKAWMTSPHQMRWNEADTLLAGRGGKVLVADAHTAVLAADGKVIDDSATVAGLVERRAKEFAEAFLPPDRRPAYGSNRLSLAADKAGSVWLLQDGGLRVLAGGKWLDVGQAAQQAEGRTGIAWTYLASVGDGSRVYFTDSLPEASGGRAHLAEVKDGKPVLADAPLAADKDWLRGCPRDPAGGAWIPAAGREGRAAVQLAIRLTEKGAEEPLKNAGRAAFCDAGGNVWLGGIKGGNAEEFNLWRDGKVAGTVAIPSARGYDTPLASDRPGSVWAWTATGLYHLTADDAAAPAKFTVKGCWQVRGLVGEFKAMEASPLGFLLLRTAFSDHSGRWLYYIHLAPLPKD